MLDFRQMVYLDAVYRYRNFTKASNSLYVTQPTISAAIRSMERDLGIVLIERSPKSVTFTEAGETLMTKIRALLDMYDDIIAEASDLGKKTSCTLRLGIASILSSDIFPLIYRDFLPSHPELIIRLDEDSAHGQIKKICDGDLDIAINGLPSKLNNSELTIIPVCSREIKLIMQSGHPFAKMERIPAHMLNGENISMLSSQGVMGEILTAAFSQHNICPNVVSEHSQIHGMMEMVLTGCSLGFVNLDPGVTQIHKYEDLVLRSFETPLNFDVGFILKKRKYIPVLYREFIDFISKAICTESYAKQEL